MRDDISKRRFIEEAQHIIDSEGIQALTIRRIGKEMNCNTGNIYYYFRNLNELATYATMRYMSDYVHALTDCMKDGDYTPEAYERLCCCYMEYTFRQPEVFRNLLYGSCADNFGKISSSYYAIFPEELMKLHPEIARLLTDENYSPLSENLLLTEFVKRGAFDAEDAAELGRIVILYNYGALQNLIDRPDRDGFREELADQYRKDIHALVERFRSK